MKSSRLIFITDSVPPLFATGRSETWLVALGFRAHDASHRSWPVPASESGSGRRSCRSSAANPLEWDVRLLLVRATLVVLTLFLLGCGRRETPVESGIRTQTLLLGNAGEPTDLDPHVVTSINDGRILSALFEGLTAWDEETGRGVPAAAERWEVSADGRMYTFHLRPNLRWSTGDPLTAADFVFSFQRILEPKFAAEYAYMLWPIKGAERFNKGVVGGFSGVGARALDERTLQVELEYPTPHLPALVAHWTWFPLHQPTLQKFSAVKQRGTRWTRAGQFVGNGPFTLSEWRPNARIVVARNAHYWDAAKTRLNSIVFLPIENAETEERNFRAGQLHVTWSLPATKIPAYRVSAPARLRTDALLGTMFLRFNTAKPPLTDPRVRRALALAIDRRGICRSIMFDTHLPANSLTPLNCGEYAPRARVESDFETARRLLAEAGFAAGQGLPPITLQVLNTEHYPQVAEAIQGVWSRELGVNVGIESLELKTAIQNQATKAYTISLLGWIADFVDPATFLELFVTDGGNNRTNWSNAEYDTLIARAARTADAKARLELFQKAEALLLEAAPIAPVNHSARVFLIHPAVKGWRPSLLAQHQFKHIALAETPVATVP